MQPLGASPECLHKIRRAGSGTLGAMLGFAMLLFPFLLLGFVLFMEKVEQPLSSVAEEREIEKFLDDANPEELDTFVREGTESGLRRFRQRLGLHRFRRNRSA